MLHCCRTKRSTLDMLSSCATMTQKSAKIKSSNLDHSQEVPEESFWTKILLSFHSCASVIDHQHFQCINIKRAITTVFTLLTWMQRKGGDSCFIARRMVQCCVITTYHQNSSRQREEFPTRTSGTTKSTPSTHAETTAGSPQEHASVKGPHTRRFQQTIQSIRPRHY